LVTIKSDALTTDRKPSGSKRVGRISFIIWPNGMLYGSSSSILSGASVAAERRDSPELKFLPPRLDFDEDKEGTLSSFCRVTESSVSERRLLELSLEIILEVMKAPHARGR